MDGPQEKYNALLSPGRRSFGSTDTEFLRRSFVAAGSGLHSGLLHLVDDLAGGSLDLQGFTAQATRRVRNAYWIVYSLGALSISPWHTITPRDQYVIEEQIRDERRFLRAFGRDIVYGVITLDPVARANLYLRGLRGIFELGRLEAAPLGPFNWDLGITEHCSPCRSAAVEGPYQKDRFSGLGLPVLPGTPGSGEVCRGLTRCGCRIVLANGLHLPNEELQGQLRDLLSEIVDG